MPLSPQVRPSRALPAGTARVPGTAGTDGLARAGAPCDPPPGRMSDHRAPGATARTTGHAIGADPRRSFAAPTSGMDQLP
jgi:hypothetical protein